jgi:hypothetical protein
MKEGDTVYVLRDRSLGLRDRAIVSCVHADTDCVSFTSGPSARMADIETYDEYWTRQRTFYTTAPRD